MKKGSWEAVFGHLGTPEEVAEEWLKMQDEIAKLKEELTACKTQEWKRRHLSDEDRISARVEVLKGRVTEACTQCSYGTMYLDSNGYSYFLRCNTCGHVLMD